MSIIEHDLKNTINRLILISVVKNFCYLSCEMLSMEGGRPLLSGCEICCDGKA